eukprot:TRINITY_DN5535_c0_g2_i1.p2 TRINITY_DN5535_c0_g2~~TRINITY_DN5535_c0_g2_i1.p2  ORF type:complete len:511 (+),score=202.17 TRINITY_DN5535_c0_g2_i1:53-1534(+)
MRDKLYINGKWVPSVEGKRIPVVNPATEEVFHHVSAATAPDVDLAVKAARDSFDSGVWSSISGADRAKCLREISKKLTEKKEELAKIETQDCGKPYREAAWDLDDVAGCFSYYADLAEELDKKQNKPLKLPDARFKTVIQYSAVGVVGAIIPWNYPLLMAAWKVAPALAAGCSVVLKPSELTPLSALELAAIIDEAGVPAGVFNCITGLGADCGAPLTNHRGVDKLAFTGSVDTGRRVMQAATADIKNVTLELGGKSPFIIFDDVDVTQAVEWIMFGCFWTNGQICSSTSRLLIQEGIAAKVLPRLAEETKKIFVGDPFTERDPSMGPLVSDGQLKRVLRYIQLGKDQGATVLTGGDRPSGKGFYVQPTVFVNVRPDMTIWREEIFGPVLSVMTFKTEEEAIRLANDTVFGLGGAVMSDDRTRCDRVVKALRAGIVWINCSQPCFVQAPWGGMKSSGIGRELGKWGLKNYLEVKQVTSYETKDPWGWFIKSKI